MKLEKIYTTLTDYIKSNNVALLLNLKEELEKAIREETAYKTTSRTRVNALKRVASQNNARPALTGYSSQHGYEVVTDSYHFVAVHNPDMPLPLVATPEQLQELTVNRDEWIKEHGDIINARYPDMKQFIDFNKSEFEEIPQDTLNLNDLTQFIKLHKKDKEMYNLKDAYFNPQYIKNIVDVLGTDYKLYYKNNVSPLYFENSDGEIGLVLPCRKF